MELKLGYKRTEVGVIPEEWEVVSLESVARIIDPQPDHRTPPESVGGEPYIGISDFVDDCSVDWDSSRKVVSRAVDKQQRSFQFGPGSIIFGKIGTIGSPKFLPAVPFRFGLSANVLLIQPRIEPVFVMSWLQSQPCQAAVLGELHSTSQAAFGIHKMRRLMIPLPPSREQRAIAEALGDVNALLSALDRLIAKKRDLKQAAMQQLLTGQIRLPGFIGEWEMKRLGESCELITKGTTPTSIGRNFTRSGVNFLKAESISESGAPIADKVAFIDTATHKLLSRSQLKEGDLLISIAGVLGRVGRVPQAILPANTNQALAVVRLRQPSQLDQRFLFYCLRGPLVMRQIADLNVQAAQANISLQNVRDLQIHVPPSLSEQVAIAEVLTETDAELTSLEQRREKTRAIKQGMMQELLTGRTRLV